MIDNNAIAVPAGWYPDPDNTNGFRYGSAPSLRYFDGVNWTEQRAPMNRRQPQAQPPIVNQVYANASPTVVVRGGTSHGFHLLMTVLTCGLWLPIWIIAAIVGR